MAPNGDSIFAGHRLSFSLLSRLLFALLCVISVVEGGIRCERGWWGEDRWGKGGRVNGSGGAESGAWRKKWLGKRW